MKFNLLENALDFLEHGVEKLSKHGPTPEELKYGLLHTATSVELFLKKRLLDEHWTLIFADLNRADKRALETGDFRSVDFDDCLQRLDKICGISFTKHKKVLHELRRMRNHIMHCAINMNRAAVLSVLVQSWSLLQDFVVDEIDLSEVSNGHKRFEAVGKTMRQHADFCQRRLSDIEIELGALKGAGTRSVDCPSCLQEAVPLTGDDTECLFCRREFSREELAGEWLDAFAGLRYWDPKERMTDPCVHPCPRCGEEALYEFEDGSMYPPDPAFLCLKCASEWSSGDLKECCYCGTLFESGTGGVMCCPDCFEYRMSKD